MKETKVILEEAKKASLTVNALSSEEKNTALEEMAKSLLAHEKEILEENEKDLAEIDPIVRENIEFIPCTSVDQVINTAIIK